MQGRTKSGDPKVGISHGVGRNLGGFIKPAQQAAIVRLFKKTMLGGTAKIGVNNQGLYAMRGEGGGQIGGNEALAFAGKSRGDEDGLGQLQPRAKLELPIEAAHRLGRLLIIAASQQMRHELGFYFGEGRELSQERQV